MPRWLHFIVVVGLGMALLWWRLTGAAPVTYAQQSKLWSTPIILSDAATTNWFADVAVDSNGTPHVVWDGGLAPADKFAPKKKLITLLMHTQLDGDHWQKPLDIVAEVQGSFTLENMPRPALSADQNGVLWLWYEGVLRHVSAPEANASAANWSKPDQISHDVVYTGNALVDQNGVLHVIYDEPTLLENPYGRGINKVTHLGDILYRRSLDHGRTWSAPFNLSRTEIGETQARLKIDAQGILYATWDEGWDRKTDEGRQVRSILRVSRDGGRSWSPKVTFSYPDYNNVQLTVAGNGRDGVLAVWRTTASKDIYYSWSADDGDSWSAPQTLPYVFARVWEDTKFDSYDLVADSAGVIHLAVVGRLQAGRSNSQLYHLSWNGKGWSQPDMVYNGAGWPESPRLTISQGNQMHMVWFVRDQLDLAYHSRYQILYSRATANSPSQPLPPTPTPTPTPTATPAPAAGLAPAVPKTAITEEEMGAIRGINASAFISDDDLPLLVAKSIIPVVMIAAGLIFGLRFLRPRLRR